MRVLVACEESQRVCIQSGRYAPIASQAAHAANEMIAEYFTVNKQKSLL